MYAICIRPRLSRSTTGLLKFQLVLVLHKKWTGFVVKVNNAKISTSTNTSIRRIYSGERFQNAENINAYLIDAPDIFVSSRSKPICDVPAMFLGNKPADGGNLIITEEERADILRREPDLAQYIHPYLGAVEFINKKIRYCFWLKDVSPSEIRKSPELMHRLEAVREMRLASSAVPTREKAIHHIYFSLYPSRLLIIY